MKDKPIGFFDSGVGGLSVLKAAIEYLPNENYIYFGDSKNAPYGTKKVEEVIDLSFKAVDFLLSKEVKAVVVACNTATSAAIDSLRQRYDSIPIIGIEPALKPAVELKRKGSIVIMATPMTLSESKFAKLMINYKEDAVIAPLPCAGLVELIESGILYGETMEGFLREKLQSVIDVGIASIVLGCTHYPFIKESLSVIVGRDIPIIDGSEGTAKQLERKLRASGILRDSCSKGTVDIYNSLESDNIIDLSYRLLKI